MHEAGPSTEQDDETDGSWRSPMQRWRRRGGISLVVAEGPDTGRTFALGNRRHIVVGRSASADVVLDHPSVSLTHFELRIEAGAVELRDLASTNGTWVGSTQVLVARIGPGAAIVAGDYTLVLGALEEVEVPIWRDEQLGEMCGRSRSMRETFARIVQVARTPLSVLVSGETGTGKELAARAIHGASDRADGPWGVFDCSSVPTNLFESALFGHVRGAFTGATTDRLGWFEKCDGGSLFIDEIGELPKELQMRLLRVIGRGEFSRMGEAEVRRADVRVIAATNRNLQKMVGEGTFREDLYFRLAQARVTLPPLRQRAGDPVLLAERAVAAVAKQRGVGLRLSDEARELVAAYQWPGNVRQLLSTVEAAAYFAVGPVVDLDVTRMDGSSRLSESVLLPYNEAHRRFDREYLRAVLDRCDGKLRRAADFLDITRPRLRKKLAEAGVMTVDP